MTSRRKMDIAYLIVALALTVAVICEVENSIWLACCLLMGREIGIAIIDIKRP